MIFRYLLIILSSVSLIACGETSTPAADDSAPSQDDAVTISDSGVKTKHIEGFGGVIAESYEDSEEWWAPEKTPKEGSPNVIIFLLDDVGFAQVESFGGLIRHPEHRCSWRRMACASITSTQPRCAPRHAQP